MEKQTEFNLSEKIKILNDFSNHNEPFACFELKDVKEFIRLLKEEIKLEQEEQNSFKEDKEDVNFEYIIDKLAGDKLNGSK